MPSSKNSPFLSVARRKILGGAAGLFVAASAGQPARPAIAAPATAVSEHPDAELIAAGEAFNAAHAEEKGFDHLPDYGYGSPENIANEEAFLLVILRKHEAIDAAADIPAKTFDGMRVKAGIILNRMPEALECSLSTEDGEIRLIMSLAEDILRRVS
jgi:hypothetical protein